jgi:alpha-glucosidase
VVEGSEPARRPGPLLQRPHHDPSTRHVSNPSPIPGEVVTVSVDNPARSRFDRFLLRTVEDGEAVWVEGTEFDTAFGHRWDFELPCRNRSVNYRFWCDGSAGPHWLNAFGVIGHDPLDHHDFRLVTVGTTPSWVPETVWYQIFPDRFATSGRHAQILPDWAHRAHWNDPVATGADAMTQLYCGDLDGIIQNLDHLVELGIGGLYLTPIFPARSNHRYDATTFDTVDPILGGDEALIRLRRACDDRGIKLMIDLTLNHTGDAHEWFRAAQADADCVEAGFYYFTEHPDDYECWLGIRSLPKLDHGSDELRRRLYDGPDSTVARYLERPFDLAGWRIDVANMTGRLGLVDHNAMVRTATRATLDAIDPQKWLVAEHFFDPSADATGDGWHGIMNYAGVARPVVSWLGEFSTLATMMPGPGQDQRDGIAVAASIDEVRASLPWQVVMGSMALLGSHDTARWQTMARSPELARIGFGLLLTLPGAPCFLYGDEIGLTGDTSEAARRPMPWDRNEWDTDLLDFYRALIRFRSASSALAHGGFRWVEKEPEALTFLRESPNERLLVRVTRAAADPLVLPLVDLATESVERSFGPPARQLDAGVLVLAAVEPSFSVWRL